MRCIFCKANSDGCVSVEHILPESLGNTEHVLPRGWVCDACNNYMACKVEKPFLDSDYGRNSRFSMRVPNKRGRVPSTFGLHAQSRTKVELFYAPDDGGLSIGAAAGEDESQWVASVQSQIHGTLYIPTPDAPASDYTTSRFIAKLATEVLAYKWRDISGWNDEIVDKPELEELRRYVRIGAPNFIWPIHIRRIYAQEFQFIDVRYGTHQVLHEWDILFTPAGECYLVAAIFGVEYVINLGGPELDGYHDWLKNNDNRSFLYNRADS